MSENAAKSEIKRISTIWPTGKEEWTPWGTSTARDPYPRGLTLYTLTFLRC